MGHYQSFARNFAVGIINIKNLDVAPVLQLANLPYATDQLTILKKLFDPGGATKVEYNRYLTPPIMMRT